MENPNHVIGCSLEDRGTPVYRCDCCNYPIYSGDIYYEVGDSKFCENCVYKKEAD